jgi:hypothetical protein
MWSGLLDFPLFNYSFDWQQPSLLPRDEGKLDGHI